MQTITQINSDIDTNIKDSPAKNIKAGVLRSILKKVTQFVDDTATGRLSAWFKISDGTPSLNATDNVYRTGKVVMGRSADDGTGASAQIQGGLSLTGIKMVETEAFGLSATTQSGVDTTLADWNTYTRAGAYVVVGASWLSSGNGPNTNFSDAWPYGVLMVIRREANDIVEQQYHTTNGEVYYRLRYFGSWGAWFSPTRNVKKDFLVEGALRFPTTTANRKVALYDPSSNDHQFFGFGINGGVLRYQVDNYLSSDHVFYAGTSPTTSNELMRIKGSGKVGIGVAGPSGLLHVGIGGVYVNTNGTDYDTSVALAVNNTTFSGDPRAFTLGSLNTGKAIFRMIGGPAGTTIGLGVVLGSTEVLTIDSNGNLGVYTTAPSERFEVSGRVATKGIRSQGTIPTIVKGAACNAAALDANSNDLAGIVTITTTTGQTAGAVIATITFTSAVARAPKVFLMPMNAAAANCFSRVYVTSTTGGFVIQNTATALDNSSSIQFSYLVVI